MLWPVPVPVPVPVLELELELELRPELELQPGVWLVPILEPQLVPGVWLVPDLLRVLVGTPEAALVLTGLVSSRRWCALGLLAGCRVSRPSRSRGWSGVRGAGARRGAGPQSRWR